MFFLESSCPVCGDGLLGFLRCSDARTVVVMCEECASIWRAPGDVELAPIFVEPPHFLLPNSDIAVSGGISGWAALVEVQRAGYRQYASPEREYVRPPESPYRGRPADDDGRF